MKNKLTKSKKKIISDFLWDRFEYDFDNMDKAEMLGGDTNQRYYVVSNGEYHGYFQQAGEFMSEDKLCTYITELYGFNGKIGKQHLITWDNIVVLDTKINQEVKPTKIVWGV